MIKRILGLLIGLLLLTACQPKTYDYGFAEGGIGGPGWPTWVESTVVNESWRIPVGGAMSGETGDENHLPYGKLGSFGGSLPLPSRLHSRWFSYRSQTFYEATIEIPKDKQAQMRQWYQQYPSNRFSHDLVLGFAGQGEIQAWWSVWCNRCPRDQPIEDYFALSSRVKATVAEGDPLWYREGTLSRIKDGRLPPEVMQLVPEDPNPPSKEEQEQYDRIMQIETTQ